MNLGIGLYVKNSVDAVKIYCEAFGLVLGYNVRNKDGSFFHSELYKDDSEMLAVVESNRNIVESPVQLGYTFSTREDLEKALSILSDGGSIKMDICELPWSPCAAEVVDRFGVDWYLTLDQHRPDDDFEANK